jgi:hypothetical protein
MLQKMLHKNSESSPSREATHSQCLALLVEVVNAIRTSGICLMCKKKISGNALQDHTPGCAVRRADVLIRKIAHLALSEKSSSGAKRHIFAPR